jgi:hypothetical protein
MTFECKECLGNTYVLHSEVTPLTYKFAGSQFSAYVSAICIDSSESTNIYKCIVYGPYMSVPASVLYAYV